MGHSYSTATPHLCWLHEDDDEHWVADDDLVGVVTRHCSELRWDMAPVPAARACAEALGEPERITTYPQVQR